MAQDVHELRVVTAVPMTVVHTLIADVRATYVPVQVIACTAPTVVRYYMRTPDLRVFTLGT